MDVNSINIEYMWMVYISIICERCKYWLHVNGEIIGYKWVDAIWMLTSDDTMKWIVNDHDWWWMDEIYIDYGTMRLTVID